MCHEVCPTPGRLIRLTLVKLRGASSLAFALLAPDDADADGDGDGDGDGHDDILVGAMLHTPGELGAGAAYLVYGPVHGTLDLAQADAKFITDLELDYVGASVAGVGDVNADGYDDLLIGAPRETADGGDGAAYLILGFGL